MNERTSIQYGDAIVIDQPNPETARVVGGVVRFQAPAAVPGPAHRQPFVGVKVHTGAVRITAGQEVDSTGFASHNMGTPVAAPTGTSIASTLNSTYGPPSVEIPGFGRTSLGAAITMGYVKREGDRIVDVQQMPGEPAAEPVTDSAPEVDQSAFSESEDALWALDIESLEQHSYDRGVSSMVAVVALGTNMDAAVASFGESAGLEPAVARDYLEQGQAMYTRTVARALAPLGLEGDNLAAFYEHTRASPARLQEAIQKLVYQRDTAGFKNWAQAFIAGRK